MTKCTFSQPDGSDSRVLSVGTVVVFPDNIKITITRIAVVVDMNFSPLVYFDRDGGEEKNRYMSLKDMVAEIKEIEEVKKDESIKQ
jgi:hypothetical protein